jgi:hypothetical protein
MLVNMAWLRPLVRQCGRLSPPQRVRPILSSQHDDDGPSPLTATPVSPDPFSLQRPPTDLDLVGDLRHDTDTSYRPVSRPDVQIWPSAVGQKPR